MALDPELAGQLPAQAEPEAPRLVAADEPRVLAEMPAQPGQVLACDLVVSGKRVVGENQIRLDAVPGDEGTGLDLFLVDIETDVNYSAHCDLPLACGNSRIC